MERNIISTTLNRQGKLARRNSDHKMILFCRWVKVGGLTGADGNGERASRPSSARKRHNRRHNKKRDGGGGEWQDRRAAKKRSTSGGCVPVSSQCSDAGLHLVSQSTLLRRKSHRTLTRPSQNLNRSLTRPSQNLYRTFTEPKQDLVTTLTRPSQDLYTTLIGPCKVLPE
jgi:hypothetical protein